MTRAALAAVLVLAIACDSGDRAERARDGDPAPGDVADTVTPEVRADDPGNGDTVAGVTLRGDYPFDRRADFRRDVGRRLETLDHQLDSASAAFGEGATRVQRRAVEQARAARREVGRSLDRFDGVTADGWDELREDIREGLDRIGTALSEARRNTGPMGGRGAGPE